MKSVVTEQKSTVSVYKRIESKPIGELDKVSQPARLKLADDTSCGAGFLM